jgi:hypothetical protein
MKQPFKDWEEETLSLTFGLNKVKDHPILLDWIQSEAVVSDENREFIEKLRAFAAERINYWNSAELKFHFIAPFVQLIDLFTAHYSTFAGRLIKEKIKNIDGNTVEIHVSPEYLVAIGQQNPRQPFFFVKEYKPEKRGNNDPLGQLLAAMVASQHKNKVDFALRGCYVLGRNWFFVVLLPDGTYSVSDAFVSTQDDIFQIYKILIATKAEIERLIGIYDFK